MSLHKTAERSRSSRPRVSEHRSGSEEDKTSREAKQKPDGQRGGSSSKGKCVHKNGKPVVENGKPVKQEKEAQAVSRLVNAKLDLYLNCRRFEDRFDPGGRRWGTATQFVPSTCISLTDNEETQLFRKHSSASINTHSKKRCGFLRQILSPGAQDVCKKLRRPRTCQCTSKEAKRINEYVQQLLSSYPIERIAEIHRYQPVVSDHEESMKIQNLRQHFGATLNSENYVKYYTEQGLNSGNPETSSRLKKITKTKSNLSETYKSPRLSPRREDARSSPKTRVKSQTHSSDCKSKSTSNGVNGRKNEGIPGKGHPQLNTKRFSTWSISECLSQSVDGASDAPANLSSKSGNSSMLISVHDDDDDDDDSTLSSQLASCSLSSFSQRSRSRTCVSSDEDARDDV